MGKKILFIAAHRTDRSPSQRFRFEQYFDFLEDQGYACKLSFIVSASDDKYLHAPAHYFRKLWIFLKAVCIRICDVLRAFRSDIVFIQREAFMTGTTFFEHLLKRSGAKIIFDFDDSIWLQQDFPVNENLRWLKDASKTSRIIGLSDMVFAGNEYLSGYARTFNPTVKIVPTTIDTDEYLPVHKTNESGPVCIGWSGSFSTIKHFESAIPALLEIKKKYGNLVTVKVIGDGNYRNEALNIVGDPWKKSSELDDLGQIDIGIMPLPDDNWSKGKCGLKGLQYMALEIPTIMSPVGVNSEIIKDGENGFLASDEKEWLTKLSWLIESKELRRRIGKSGRKTVEKDFSVNAIKQLYLNYFNELLS